MFTLPSLVSKLSEFTENFRNRGEKDPTVAIEYHQKRKEVFDEELLRLVYNLWHNRLRTRLSGEKPCDLKEVQYITQNLSAALTFIQNNNLYTPSIKETVSQLIEEIDICYQKSFFPVTV